MRAPLARKVWMPDAEVGYTKEMRNLAQNEWLAREAFRLSAPGQTHEPAQNAAEEAVQKKQREQAKAVDAFVTHLLDAVRPPSDDDLLAGINSDQEED
jgi:hypothetical protein